MHDILEIFSLNKITHALAAKYWDKGTKILFYRSDDGNGNRELYDAAAVNAILCSSADEDLLLKKRVVSLIPILDDESKGMLASALRGKALQAVRNIHPTVGRMLTELRDEQGTVSFSTHIQPYEVRATHLKGHQQKDPRKAGERRDTIPISSGNHSHEDLIARLVGAAPERMEEAALDPDARAKRLRSRFKVVGSSEEREL